MVKHTLYINTKTAYHKKVYLIADMRIFLLMLLMQTQKPKH